MYKPNEFDVAVASFDSMPEDRAILSLSRYYKVSPPDVRDAIETSIASRQPEPEPVEDEG